MYRRNYNDCEADMVLEENSKLQEAIDLIGSIHNDCEIFNILVSQHREDLCYTVAEDLYSKAQTLVDDFCVGDE